MAAGARQKPARALRAVRAAGPVPRLESISRPGRTKRRFALLMFVAALGWSGWLAHLHIAGRATPLDYLEAAATDLRMRLAGPRMPPNDVAIVAIDDEIVPGKEVFPSLAHDDGAADRTIAAAHPRALAVDVLFLEDGRQPERIMPSPPPSARCPPSGGGSRLRRGHERRGIPVATAVHRPIPVIGAAALTGLGQPVRDAAGVPRHLPLVARRTTRCGPFRPAHSGPGGPKRSGSLREGQVRIGPAVFRPRPGYHLPLRPYGRDARSRP